MHNVDPLRLLFRPRPLAGRIGGREGDSFQIRSEIGFGIGRYLKQREARGAAVIREKDVHVEYMQWSLNASVRNHA